MPTVVLSLSNMDFDKVAVGDEVGWRRETQFCDWSIPALEKEEEGGMEEGGGKNAPFGTHNFPTCQEQRCKMKMLGQPKLRHLGRRLVGCDFRRPSVGVP